MLYVPSKLLVVLYGVDKISIVALLIGSPVLAFVTFPVRNAACLNSLLYISNLPWLPGPLSISEDMILPDGKYGYVPQQPLNPLPEPGYES